MPGSAAPQPHMRRNTDRFAIMKKTVKHQASACHLPPATRPTNWCIIFGPPGSTAGSSGSLRLASGTQHEGVSGSAGEFRRRVAGRSRLDMICGFLKMAPYLRLYVRISYIAFLPYST